MSESQSFKRPHCFSGKLLTPEDFQLEQEYFLKKLKRHNRSLHGFGIVSGLGITVGAGQIVIEPGLALDCEGNELAVDCGQSVALPPIGESRTAYLSVRYVEKPGDPVSAAERQEFSTIAESFEFSFSEENSNRRHRHLRARWLACGQAHALTIAKLRPSLQGWRVDRGFRAPVVK